MKKPTLKSKRENALLSLDKYPVFRIIIHPKVNKSSSVEYIIRGNNKEDVEIFISSDILNLLPDVQRELLGRMINNPTFL